MFRIDLYDAGRYGSGHSTTEQVNLASALTVVDRFVDRSLVDGKYRRGEVREVDSMEAPAIYVASGGTLPSRCRETLSQEA